MVSDQNLVKKITGFLKEKRLEAGLTQKAVAEKFGYTSGQFVSNWERGLVMPPLKTIRQLAELYGANLNEIYEMICEETQRVVREQLYSEEEGSGTGEKDSVSDSTDRFDLKPHGTDFLAN